MRSAHTPARQANTVAGSTRVRDATAGDAVTGKTTVGATLYAVVASLAVAVLLGGCTPGGTEAEADGVTGTTWSGVDSQQRPTSFTFDEDGTVDVTYFDDSFNDELDTWALEGSTITITVFVSEEAGSAVYTGEVNLGDSAAEAPVTMALSATTTATNETFTVDLTRN